MIPPRIELGTFCVLGRCDNRYTTESRLVAGARLPRLPALSPFSPRAAVALFPVAAQAAPFAFADRHTSSSGVVVSAYPPADRRSALHADVSATRPHGGSGVAGPRVPAWSLPSTRAMTQKVRQPGIEPGSTAWKATMLTTTPLSHRQNFVNAAVLLTHGARAYAGQNICTAHDPDVI